MTTLGRKKITDLLSMPNIEDRLIVTPLFSKDQIGEASIDIRIGNMFIVTRKGNLLGMDVARDMLEERRSQSRHYVNFHEQFFLHPNELVLAGTLEFFRLPNSVAAVVTSRSSWGRAGLVIATATAVHPGFKGTLTLELVNVGEVPLVLYPGISVAQIVFSACEGGVGYSGRFANHIEAETPNLSKDKRSDLEYWTQLAKS